MASGKTEEVETQGVRDDGSTFYVRNRAIPYRDSKGRMQGFIKIVEDITERKQAQEKQIEANREKAAYLDAMSDGIIVHDPKGNVVAVNPAWERMHGYKKEEVKKLSAQELFTKIMPPDSIRKVKDIFKSIFEKGISGNAELSVHAKDGRKFPAQISFLPLKDEKGSFKGMVVSASDITERRKIEEEIRVSAAIAENLAEGIYLIGLDDLIIKWANSRFEKMFG